MSLTSAPRALRIESALAYFVVSLMAVIFVQWQFDWSLTDTWIVVGFASFAVVAGIFGALFAHWYLPQSVSWFEVISVPAVSFLLAAISGSLLGSLSSVTGVASLGRISLYEWASAAVGPAFTFLALSSPLLVVLGLAASLLLRYRATRVRFAT